MKIIRPRGTPSSVAARMKSSSRRERNLLRTTRARAVQPISERMTVIMKYTCTGDQSSGTTAASASQSGMVGME